MNASTFLYGDPPRPLRVLVADDNADSTDSLATLLRLVGCEVAVAYEGSAVAPVAAAFHPDVCVLDIRMPGVHGWDVAKQLRVEDGGDGLLLIALTGFGDRASKARSADAGFDCHIVKPAEAETIFHELTEFIRRAVPLAAV